MRAYYHDDVEGDQNLPHDSGRSVSAETLQTNGVLYWSIPIDEAGRWQEQIDQVAEERHYKNRDTVAMSKDIFGDSFETRLKVFYDEHIHEDEEIRFVVSGSAYFDVREFKTDAWIRIHVFPGDLLVLPAGIYHRFTLDTHCSVKALRLFKDEPVWTAHPRSTLTDENPRRVEYVRNHRTMSSVGTV